ncbi:MAG: hypothetical protein R3A45_12060 [Bdellovibrionota bacterium]
MYDDVSQGKWVSVVCWGIACKKKTPAQKGRNIRFVLKPLNELILSFIDIYTFFGGDKVERVLCLNIGFFCFWELQFIKSLNDTCD